MFIPRYVSCIFLVGMMVLAGCQQESDRKGDAKGKPAVTEEDKAEIKAALAQLSDEDRKLAEAQKFCPVQDTKRLGWMGKPFKIELEGQSVFLCCKSCEKQARANTQRTLERVAKWKKGE